MPLTKVNITLAVSATITLPEMLFESLQWAKIRPAAVAEQTGRLTWIFFVMFDESLQRAKTRPAAVA